MHYPIVKVITVDNLELFGLLAEAKKHTDAILINIHGTASAFYIEEFEKYYVEKMPQKGISVLFTNNRGNYVMESWQKTGAAQEKFEDCLIDIDTWIEFALSKGYKKVILQGHSLGSEKVVYYMNKGKYRNKVTAVILLGFSDLYGTQMRFLQTIKADLMKEARKLIKEGKGYMFLTSEWLSHAGILPMSAESYVNFFSEGSELSKALPLRNGSRLELFSKIKVPILGVIGDDDKKEFTVIPVKDAIKLLEKENKLAEVWQIKDCDHSFTGRQKELVDVVSKFILQLTHKSKV